MNIESITAMVGGPDTIVVYNFYTGLSDCVTGI